MKVHHRLIQSCDFRARIITSRGPVVCFALDEDLLVSEIKPMLLLPGAKANAGRVFRLNVVAIAREVFAHQAGECVTTVFVTHAFAL